MSEMIYLFYLAGQSGRGGGKNAAAAYLIEARSYEEAWVRMLVISYSSKPNPPKNGEHLPKRRNILLQYRTNKEILLVLYL